MMTAPASSRSWPLRRWLAFIAVILLGQFACIFWLNGKRFTAPQVVPIVPRVYVPAGSRAELPDVSSPTLFVFANRRGFSGPAWLNIPSQQFDSPPWSEPPRPLALPAEELGGELAEFVRTNAAGAFELTPPPAPPPDFAFTDDNAGAAQSTLTLEGGLANRQLMSQFKLASQPASDILTNSEVLAGVDAQGGVFSAVLLKSCGSKEADETAVKLAGTAQFQPARWAGPGISNPAAEKLTWGEMVFHWHTTPLLATNNVTP
jgi:TonB family protein